MCVWGGGTKQKINSNLDIVPKFLVLFSDASPIKIHSYRLIGLVKVKDRLDFPSNFESESFFTYLQIDYYFAS